MRFEWQGVYENWAKAWVHKNFWRVEHRFGTKDDALQQCAMVFAKCLQRYADVVDNPRWFMALFKRAVIHHWTHHSKLNSQQRQLALPEESIPETGQTHNGAPMLPNSPNENQALVNIWESASPELQQGLRLLLTTGQKVLDAICDDSICPVKLNRRWQRFAGIHSEHNIVLELRELLEAGEWKGPEDAGSQKESLTSVLGRA